MFFEKQHIAVKVIILLTGSAAAIFVPIKALISLFIVTLVYYLLEVGLFSKLVTGFKLLLPFLALYSLLSLITGISYPEMLIFMLRVLSLMMLVVYFSASMSIKSILEDTQSVKQLKYCRLPLFFCVSTILYLRKFITFYNQQKKKSPSAVISVTGMITTLVESIHINWMLKEQIQEETEILLSNDYNPRYFLTKYNIIGLMYLTFLILVLSI